MAGVTQGILWYQWCEGTASLTAAADTTNSTSGPWTQWVQNTATSTTATVWIKWTGGTGTANETCGTFGSVQAAPQYQQYQAPIEFERQRTKVRERQEAANRRAEELLKSHLSTSQRDEYEKDKRFTVTSQSGKRYEIKPGWGHNVKSFKPDGKPDKSFCLVHRERIPVPDLLLTQKLMLENQEDEFLRIANAYPFYA